MQELKQAIESKGLTQSKVARQIRVSKTVMNDYVSGRRAISKRTAIMLELIGIKTAQHWLNLQHKRNLLQLPKLRKEVTLEYYGVESKADLERIKKALR